MGPYDNDAGRYLPSEDWDDGQWVVDDDGVLFILPIGADEISGPEGTTHEVITQRLIATRSDSLDETAIEELHLTVVSPALKRFDPEIGYFSA
jgi:hypothetical protein